MFTRSLFPILASTSVAALALLFSACSATTPAPTATTPAPNAGNPGNPNRASASFDCTTFLQFGGNVSATRTAFANGPEQFAWNWFACFNQATSGTSQNRVWETLKPTDQVFLSNGAAPLPYAQRTPLPTAVQSAAQAAGMDMNRVFHEINSTQQVDGLIVQMGGSVPAAQRGKPVRFQLLMSQDTFDYIVAKQVYNVNGQAALTADLNFTPPSWEIKTAWLWIGQDAAYKSTLQNDGYYIGQAYYRNKDGSYEVGYAALSGMHVINKLFPEWVWTTFENVNNPKYTVTNGAPAAPLTNSTGPTAAAAAQNSRFQAALPALAKYELIGVQWTTNPITPTLLANSQLESAFQGTSSCLACHATAAYSAQKGYFNFALPSPDGGGIAYPVALLPDSAYAGYKRLDYVWSLKRAQWKR